MPCLALPRELFRPIAEAPIRPGEAFNGQFLLEFRPLKWVVGMWDGDHWFPADMEGQVLEPLTFLLLPGVLF
jgi:hypothetical protein